MLYLVRHGHAGNKRTWNGPDPQRPLSPNGAARERRAHRPAPCRTDRQDSVQSGPALPTDRPALAEQRRLAVELDQRLAVEADLEQVTGMVFNPALGDAVLCTHGELIGQLLGLLCERGTPIGPDAQWLKGRPGPCRSTATPYPLRPTCRHRVARFPDPDRPAAAARKIRP